MSMERESKKLLIRSMGSRYMTMSKVSKRGLPKMDRVRRNVDEIMKETSEEV